MTNRLHRSMLLTGLLAVVLWIVGLVVHEGLADSLSESASDQQILAWVQGNTNYILTGGWLFMVGCLCFVWFLGALRARLLDAEGGAGTLATIAFAGGLATAIFGMLTQAGDLALAIDKDDVSAATAGALHHATDAFFVGAELSAILLTVATAVLALRSGVLPRWWAIFSLLLAVVLVIGPIGWAGLIFGVPIWTIGTSLQLALGGGRRARTPVATAP
ncbi:MAG TPA: hypothetical protein VFI37_06120 [Gaiellaceae bacterium]|jgi:hypothetical protein|nr:hypothetical protein [Gaiellaceae bacterium]